MVAPGVGSASKIFRVTDDSEEIIKHKYYQWVFLVLLVQAFMFYLPRFVWKVWEGGRIHLLVERNSMFLIRYYISTEIKFLFNYRFKYSINW